MIYDSHTHLNADRLFENREDYYNNFVDAWWQWIITVWMDPKHNQRAIAIAIKTKENPVPVKITLWIHPYEVWNWSVLSKKDVDKQITLIKEQLQDHKEYVVAIGEWWIDAHYEWYNTRKSIQAYAFEQQCLLAREYDLPIVIHSRDQFEDTLDIIKHYADLKVYYHCFWYWKEEVKTLVEAFPRLRIGFCGNSTYPKAHALREWFSAAWMYQSKGKCNILFETDAPYLTPQKRRGTTNEPAYVWGIYEFISETFSLPRDELNQTIESSFKALYNY